uniref:Exosome complex component MTR3-like n=1 Tax=Hirondellea gigas TaxID=1518452 RepID=A0A6A7GAU8_9CRUS
MDSYRPKKWADPDAKMQTESSELSEDAAARPDNRSQYSMRPVFIKTQMVNQAAGSAYIEIQNTKVIVAVYGPRHNPKMALSEEKGQLVCDFKYAPFATQTRRQSGQGDDERAMSSWLKDALITTVILEKFPKSVVEVFVTVLEADGGELAAAVIACSVALASARIEMYDLISAHEVVRTNSRILVDPTLEELNSCQSRLLLSFTQNLQEVTNILQAGNMSMSEFQEMYEACLNGCKHLHEIMLQKLKKSMKKRIK